MARNGPLAVLVLAVLVCPYDCRPVMMASNTRYVAPRSFGTVAMVNRNDPTAEETAGANGDGPRSSGAMSTAIGQRGCASVNNNTGPVTRRSYALPHKSSHVGSGNPRHDRAGVSIYNHPLSSRSPFALLLVSSKTGGVKHVTHDIRESRNHFVFESRPLSSSMTTVTTRATSGVPKSSPSSRLLISNTTITRASSDLKTSSLSQHLAFKTSVTNVKGSVSESSLRLPAPKKVITSPLSGVSGTLSIRLSTSKKVVTSAPNSVPKSSLKSQLLASKTTLPNYNMSKSSQSLASKTAKTRVTSVVPVLSSLILASKTDVTRTTSDISMSSSEQLLSNVSITTSDVLLSSPKLVSNTLITRTTNGVLKSSTKLKPSKKIVSSSTMSGIPKLSSSQFLASKTSSTRVWVEVPEASLLISKTSFTMNNISESSSSQLPASKTGIVSRKLTRSRSYSRNVSKVRRMNKKVTPRFGTKYDQTKVYSDHRSNSYSTQKYDSTEITQDPFPSDDTDQIR